SIKPIRRQRLVQLIKKCAKGIDATKLAQEFVTFLHSLDKAQ
ncbi:ParB family partitioning protein, partial [Pseudomonas amygdali pv. mori str. 301020]